MANYSVDELANALVQRGGYNPTDARSAAMNSGGRADELAREFLGVSSGGSSGGGNLSNPIDLARQFQQFQIEANQPAIQSLQASIPVVQQQFAGQRVSLEAERNPLEQRYQSLLADITKTTQLATSREFGRRGISTESGLYDTTLAERISPETERIGLARESDLRNLTNLISSLTSGEATATSGIQNQIAQLLTGNAPGAIGAATNWQQVLEQARQFDVGTGLQREQLNQPETEVITANGRKLLVNKRTGDVIQDLGSSSEGTDSDLGELATLLGLGGNTGTTGSDWEEVQSSVGNTGRRGGFGPTTTAYG